MPKILLLILLLLVVAGGAIYVSKISNKVSSPIINLPIESPSTTPSSGKPVILPNNSTTSTEPISAIWEKELNNIDVSPSVVNCLGKSPKQKFSARLSKQFPNTVYKGTFLQLSGSPTVEYVSEINSSRYASRKLLEYDLWKSGFRVLELKFSSKTGWEPSDHPDEQWRSTGMVCETEPLVKALKNLEEKGMWPKIIQNRFAMGTSNGALLLAYAIDFHKSSYAKMNRVLLQSPIVYDLYNQCKEMPISQFSDFYFGSQCRNPDNNKNFFESQQIKSKLNVENCAMTTGENSYLIILGKNKEVPTWYKDESQRYVPDREKLCPLKTVSWDAPIKYEGHSPIIDYYKINGNINAFVNYFLKGEVNFIN